MTDFQALHRTLLMALLHFHILAVAPPHHMLQISKYHLD